jgi:hypothetical protein
VDISYSGVSSLNSFTNFIPANDTEKRPAELFATIIGTILKWIEYTRPIILAMKFKPRKA